MSTLEPGRPNARPLLLFGALAWITACDGFGHEIVGVYPVGHSREGICNVVAAPCTPVTAFLPLAPRPAPTLLGGSCADPGKMCDVSTLPATLNQCELVWPLNAGVNNQLTELQCAHVTFAVQDGVANARLEHLIIANTELELTASSPVTVEFAHATLLSTRITLRGPITLRFSEDSGLSDTQIADQSPAGASLELRESTLSDFAAIDLRGMAHVERSRLTDTQLFARQVELENTAIQRVGIKADQLFAAELAGAQLTLEIGDGVLSAVDVDLLKLQRCDTLLITNSVSYGSLLGACTDRLRVDRSSFGKGTAQGPIESHITIWDQMTFGPGAPASLESWNDSLSNSRLCSTLTRLTLSEPTTLTCNECDELGAAAADRLCAPPLISELAMSPESIIQHNSMCPALGHLATCNPAPTNPNPF